MHGQRGTILRFCDSGRTWGIHLPVVLKAGGYFHSLVLSHGAYYKTWNGMEWLVDVVRQSSFWGSRFFSCKNTTPGSGSKLQPVECNYHSYTILDLPSDTDPRKTFYGFMVKLGNRRKGFGTWGGDRQISTTCFPSHILVWYDCSLYLPTTLKLPNT